ncbi:MAG TPA: hypothetical protein VNA68_00280 [Candidatus Dormibacteraeota bacterium]|nr:hypothetical protein [Candidatus Dormibacteraeota bacterium]
MGLFICTKCGCVENTALSKYAINLGKRDPLCSECDPEIGQWHGMFEKKLWDGQSVVKNPDQAQDHKRHRK